MSPFLSALIPRRALVALVLLGTFGFGSAAAVELRLLSGGAVEPGLKPAVAAFEAATGHRVALTFNPAPQLAARLAAGEAWDVVIGPVAVLDGAAKEGRIGAERVGVGRVGIGVAVRADAPRPEIGDADALKRSLLAADSVVYNRASTGIAFERVLRELGIADAVAAKATRPVDGAQVMEQLLRGQGREVGFGAITEILLFRKRGVRYLGPLPPALQVYTAYAAALPGSGARSAAARQLLEHLAGREAQAIFAGAGIDPAP
jgi:molybdate transport system substrate-binding protein